MNTLCKVYVLFIFLAFALLVLPNCLEVIPESPDSPQASSPSPEIADKPQSDPVQDHSLVQQEKFFQDIYGNRISYNDPESFLDSGSQSDLIKQNIDLVKSQIKVGNNNLEDIGIIYKWKQNYFKTHAAGGKFVGKITANQIIEKKELSGCHDHGLIMASVFRLYGYPAIMVDAAGIQWARDYSQGTTEGFKGHVFIEVFVTNKWILINSTSGKYIDNYNPADPVIPMTDPAESKGYYAILKGTDPAGYGINSNEQLTQFLTEFADQIDSTEISYTSYVIKQLPLP